MKNLQGKVVVITGAGSGIGRALAIFAATRGASLALADWNEAGLEETAELTGASPGRLFTRKLDVRDDSAVNAFAADVKDKLRGADVIVNNAGVSLSHSIGLMKREDFEWIMDINFWGVVRGTEAFLPQLLAKEEGHVVNVSSIFGVIAVPRQSAYNASKFAVRGYTEALSAELRKTRVKVTVVLPGGVRTGIVTNGRQYENLSGQPTDPATLGKTFERIAGSSPEEAAQIIWSGVLRGAPRVLVGRDARLADLVQRLFPTRYSRVLQGTTRLAGRLRGVRL